MTAEDAISATQNVAYDQVPSGMDECYDYVIAVYCCLSLLLPTGHLCQSHSSGMIGCTLALVRQHHWCEEDSYSITVGKCGLS